MYKCPIHFKALDQSKHTPTSYVCFECKNEGKGGIFDVSELKNGNLVKEDINYIVKEFDAEKVHKVMMFLNWRWIDTGIPTAEQIRAKALKLLKDTQEKVKTSSSNNYAISTGGLYAESFIENNKIYSRIVFVLDKSDNF